MVVQGRCWAVLPTLSLTWALEACSPDRKGQRPLSQLVCGGGEEHEVRCKCELCSFEKPRVTCV